METGNVQHMGKWIKLPQVTTTERDAISSPAEGFEVYNTVTHTVDTYNGTTWTNGVQSLSGANQILSAEVVTAMPAVGDRVANRLYFLIG